MFKVNTIVIGIGEKGISAIECITKANMPEIRTAVFCPDTCGGTNADYIFKSKYDFINRSDKLFLTPETAVFIIADCTDTFEISIISELAFLTARMGGFSVALAHMPSPASCDYPEACEALCELHECFDGVVRFNEGYCDSFESETAALLGVLSRAMSTEAVNGIKDYEQLKALFEHNDDIYFASVRSKESYESHTYRAKCLELKLCAQTYVDTANHLDFFYSCNGAVSRQILDTFALPLEKINIAFMSTINTYITDYSPELDRDEFVFGVICTN